MNTRPARHTRPAPHAPHTPPSPSAHPAPRPRPAPDPHADATPRLVAAALALTVFLFTAVQAAALEPRGPVRLPQQTDSASAPAPSASSAQATVHENYALGLAARQAGHPDSAVARFRAVLAAAPGHAPAHANVARALLDLGRPHEALEHATTATELAPESASHRRVLARALDETGDLEGAAKTYDEALWIDQDDRWSLNNLGFLLIRMGMHADAIGPLALATRIDSTSALFFNNLGAALEGAGHPVAALDAFSMAAALDPGTRQGRKQRGAAGTARGSGRDARGLRHPAGRALPQRAGKLRRRARGGSRRRGGPGSRPGHPLELLVPTPGAPPQPMTPQPGRPASHPGP